MMGSNIVSQIARLVVHWLQVCKIPEGMTILAVAFHTRIDRGACVQGRLEA